MTESKIGEDCLLRMPHDRSQLRSTYPPPPLPPSRRRYYPEQANSFQRLFPSRFTKNSLFARNNPHPSRVTHIKGLLDAPICCVQDGLFDGHRAALPEPIFDPRVYGSKSGMIKYPGYVGAGGGGPDDPIWKEELERLTKHVVARAAMGRPATMHGPRSQSRLLQSRSANRSDPVLAALDDTTILELLCRILQTDSIPTIQAWLSSAPDSEKDLVMNMLGMAATGELTYATPREGNKSRPESQQVQYKPQWDPASSLVGAANREPEEPSQSGADENEAHLKRWLNRQSQLSNRRPMTGDRRSVKSEGSGQANGLQRVPLSRSSTRSSAKFAYVSTWTGSKEPLQEE